MIQAAINASSKLRGTAAKRIPEGKTPRFPIVTRISTKPANQEIKVVCHRENFLDGLKGA